MATWTTLTNTALGAYKILRAATMQALYDNPQAIAERATNAPVVQVPVRVQKNPGDTSWAWPDGVTAATFILQAAGGGGSDASGPDAGDGGNTTITYNSITYTATGGQGGAAAGTAGAAGSGGTCTIKENGRADQSSKLGNFQSTAEFYGYGGGGNGSGGGGRGGAGEYGEVRLVRVNGLNTVTLSIGVGGTNAYTAVDGADGVIFIEY